MRPSWDFEYLPARRDDRAAAESCREVVVASSSEIDPVDVARLFEHHHDVEVTTLLCAHPLHWTRVRAAEGVSRRWLAAQLAGEGHEIRYVVPAHSPTELGPSPLLDFGAARPRRPRGWRVLPRRSHSEPVDPGRWFLGESGLAVDRVHARTGSGTRLAVIDNDAGCTGVLPVDGELLVDVVAPPRGSNHGASMIGWAVGTNDGFVGVAPDASPRLYCIPKPDGNLVALPLAIARAADDGADVIVCATNVEGQYSPLLDDALAFAHRLGRGGRGCAIVMPASREVPSHPSSVHASLTLTLSDPASDPRVFCIGPSAAGGGWFLWQDRRGRWRPFSNRGPALRWLAPGDDMAHPFLSGRRGHAESSGAAALAAGALLLVLEANPELTISELEALISRTAANVPRVAPVDVADPFDLMPCGTDRDGHNAKHGYGRIHARRACLVAGNPLALAALEIGDEGMAESASCFPPLESCCSVALFRLATRVFLASPTFAHAAKTLVRHLRLVGRDPLRARAHGARGMLLQLAGLVRLLQAECRGAIDGELELELWHLHERIRAIARDPARLAQWQHHLDMFGANLERAEPRATA